MQKQSWTFFLTALALMGVTVGGLAYYRAHQRLGAPGVKVAPQSVYDSEGRLIGTNMVVLPERVLGFTSTNAPIAKVVSEWLPKDTVYGCRIYQATNGAQVAVTVVLMGTDRTSIHKPQQCLVANGYVIDQSEPATIPIAQPQVYELPAMRLSVRRAAATGPGASVVHSGYYVYWFVADRQLTASHWDRIRLMTRDLLLRGVLQRWAYVSFLMEFPAGQEEPTWRQLREFVSAAVPQFQLTHGPPTALAGNARPEPAARP